MTFKTATLAQRQAVRDAVIELDKAVQRAHDTGPLNPLGDEVDTLGAVAVAALNATGSAASGTTAIVTNGQTPVVMANSANSKTVNGTAVVANGAVSRVSAPATAALITSGQALTGVTPTGTFATTVTFTVANGVITAIALS